ARVGRGKRAGNDRGRGVDVLPSVEQVRLHPDIGSGAIAAAESQAELAALPRERRVVVRLEAAQTAAEVPGIAAIVGVSGAGKREARASHEKGAKERMRKLFHGAT